jgi:VWFA-related protein
MSPLDRLASVSRLLLLALPLAGAAPAPPAAPAATAAPVAPAAGTPGFEETSQVVAVEIPVNVVDREGRPVRGLTAKDFEILDGNDRQKISGFDVVDLQTLAPAPADAPPGPAEELPAKERRHFLLLFDLSFSSPTAILKARLAARDFLLHSLHPADLAAVATYSLEQGPRLVVTFTPDRAQLARAIDTLGMNPVVEAGVKRDPLFFVLDNPDLLDLEAESRSSNSGAAEELRTQRDQAIKEYITSITSVAERDERNFERSRITTYTKALGAMARTLNAVPGRKHVVFFSEGFDSKLLLGRSEGSEEADQENDNIARGRTWLVDNDQRFGNTELQNVLGRMLEEFRRADCVIQAVDIGGLRAGSDAGGRSRENGQEALFYMANETGGELFKDTNNLGKQLESVLERTGVTYLLTFERSDLKLDGSYHRLKVKAKLPPGARMTYRTGYYAPRPYRELDPLEKSLLASGDILGATPRADLDVNVLVAPFRSTERLSYVPVIIEVPGRKLLEGQSGDKLNVEFYAYVSDGRGQMKDFFNQAVGMDVQKGREALVETGIKYYGHFDLPPGDYRVRVLVRNADTGRTVVSLVPVTVPSYGQAQPVLLPPFFMEERRSWVLVRENGRSGQKSVVYPFTIHGDPYVPAARPVLRPEEAARLCLVAYNLGKGALSIQGQVTATDGKVLPGGHLALVERTSTGIGGLDKLLATFEPTGLAAGDYVLQVAVTDPATGHREASSLPFQVIQR